MASGDVTYIVLFNMGILHLILKTKKHDFYNLQNSSNSVTQMAVHPLYKLTSDIIFTVHYQP